MARTKITKITEETDGQPEAAPVETSTELSITERLALIIDPEADDYFSRVYRETNSQRGGAVNREFLERVDGVLVDEEYIAENYGGGRFFVRYTYHEKGVLKNTSTTFSIAGEYRPKSLRGQVTQAPAQKSPLTSFLEGLTAEKVVAFTGALEAFKKFIAPPPPPPPAVDVTGLIKALLEHQKPQPLSEAIVLEAVKGSNRPAPPVASPLELVEQAEKIKALVQKGVPETTETDDDEENGGTVMNLIKTALELLPGYLAKNNNNFEATGAQFKDNILIKGLLAKDPNLAGEFVDAARAEYGDLKAQELARGFGLDVQYVEPPEEPQQLENQQTAQPAQGV